MNNSDILKAASLVYQVRYEVKDGIYEAWHDEFERPVVVGYGKTLKTATENLDNNRQLFILGLLCTGQNIPEPLGKENE